MTKADLMKYLSVSRGTIDRLMIAGLPFVKLDPKQQGHVRFYRSAVDKWLKSRVK